jgi:hypothetical protein
MNKQKEDAINVWYRFDIGIPGETYIDERGRERPTIKTIYGVCRFNKQDLSLEFEEDQTDPYFLSNPLPYKNGCWSRMLACHKRNYYPDKECYACG